MKLELKNKILFKLVSAFPDNYWLRLKASKFLILVDKQSNAYFNVYNFDNLPINKLANKLDKHPQLLKEEDE